MPSTSCTYGALALECSAPLAQSALPRDAAAELAGHVAADLAGLLPGVDALDLAVAGAAFDPAELLRPGWPLHAALADLIQRAPGREGPRVLGFGTYEGAMPRQLSPDPELREGPLRLLPFVLHGDADIVAATGHQMEEVLVETGMARADTALYAQQNFATPLEHVRYLSLNDLLAMTSLQYEHAGVGALWPIIEAALLTPEREEWVDAPPEPLLRWDGTDVHIALMDMAVWLEAGYAQALQPQTPIADTDAKRLARNFDHFQMRLQQFANILRTHAIPFCFDHVAVGQQPHDILRL